MIGSCAALWGVNRIGGRQLDRAGMSEAVRQAPGRQTLVAAANPGSDAGTERHDWIGWFARTWSGAAGQAI